VKIEEQFRVWFWKWFPGLVSGAGARRDTRRPYPGSGSELDLLVIPGGGHGSGAVTLPELLQPPQGEL
jgi:hypothetical protein